MNTLKENIAAQPEIDLLGQKQRALNTLTQANRNVEIIQFMVTRAEIEPNKRFRGQPLGYWRMALDRVKKERNEARALVRMTYGTGGATSSEA